MSRLAWLALALLPGAAAALPAETRVVVIGNNHGDPTELSLRYALDDARQIAEVMRSLGGVPSHQIAALFDEDAAAVRHALLATNASFSRSEAPSALIVYYSGHADADTLHMGGSRLPFEELRALVEGSPARMRLLIVDACRSGGVSRVKGVRAAPDFHLDVVGQGAAEGLAIITSSAASESSQESDRLGGSFFTHHWVNGLRGAADLDADGHVTLAEAYRYAYDGTLRSSGQTLALQHATYAWDLKGRGELILTRTDTAAPRTGRLKLRTPTVHLVYGGGGDIVAEVAPPREGAVLSLPPRAYRVQERLPHAYREYAVELAPGGLVDLAAAPARTVAYDRLVRQRGGTSAVVHGLGLLAGSRGALVPGEGLAPHLVLAYGADTPWFSAGLRLRGAVASVPAEVPRRHEEYGLGLLAQRFIDLSWSSLAFGVLVEGAWHRQVFTGADAPPTRGAFAGGFGALLALERALVDGLSLRLEGGPTATVLRTSEVERGRAIASEAGSVVTWWASGGLQWRL
ncbi:MAG: caspase family protein [Myxococcales bacterium]|nr:caspase family protein [Myxococcales bacterium]